jgi:hypothetical protein
MYYNAESKKILSSQNYTFLIEKEPQPSEEIVISDTPSREGEREKYSAREKEETTRTNQKHKQAEEDGDKPRKTRGRRQDYRQLADPWSDEETMTANHDNDQINLLSEAMVVQIDDEFRTLKEAKDSPEWPEWEKAIRSELDQHQEKGTWELVEKPEGARLLNNKWVFVLKRDKEGLVIKHKARLIVEGCGQHPGDYFNMHSPVVRIESIRAILAIATAKGLRIQQMDVKGAYLNGILKETLYMRQPDGFDDGSGRVCQLKRTLYGLKQSGREWNVEFNTKMRGRGYKRLRADPCVYTRSDKDKIRIVTVWVDDLLLFANSEDTMKEIKNDIHTEWETTDMGDPTKIVGIEITQSASTISISQKKGIQRILEQQGLDHATSVQMPLDPNLKIVPNPEGNEGDQSNAYAQLLGELQFIANSTRPDIAFAVN